MTSDKRDKTVADVDRPPAPPLSYSVSSEYLAKNNMACSRIHCLAFSRFPAAMIFEFDGLLLSEFDAAAEALLSLVKL